MFVFKYNLTLFLWMLSLSEDIKSKEHVLVEGKSTSRALELKMNGMRTFSLYSQQYVNTKLTIIFHKIYNYNYKFFFTIFTIIG